MGDPFGEDEVDFPIQIWCDKFLENQLAFLEYEYEGANNCFDAKLWSAKKLEWHPGEVTSFIGVRDFRRYGGKDPGEINVRRNESHGVSGYLMPLQARLPAGEY